MKLGIIGVGHLATALLKGLQSSQFLASDDIILSPRGSSKSLAADFGFRIATDNASLVETSDTILLAVRPRDTLEAIRGLPWRADHVLLSCCAGVPTAALSPLIGKATVVRMMPTIAAEFGQSATLIYPSMPRMEPFFGAIGKTYALENEDQFEVGSVSAAVFGWAQALIKASSDWSTQKGMPEDQSKALMAQTFISAGTTVAASDLSMTTLLENLATPGGITEAGLNHLNNTGALGAWDGASDAALARLEQNE